HIAGITEDTAHRQCRSEPVGITEIDGAGSPAFGNLRTCQRREQVGHNTRYVVDGQDAVTERHLMERVSRIEFVQVRLRIARAEGTLLCLYGTCGKYGRAYRYQQFSYHVRLHWFRVFQPVTPPPAFPCLRTAVPLRKDASRIP